ncbi:MAG: hypothetical protein LAO55_01005 [Acidobacteriia bacterium]|nr:hypothetical protein [Terriglobia bacterium]
MALKTTQIRVATLLLAVWPALAQVTVTVKPVSMPGAQSKLGSARYPQPHGRRFADPAVFQLVLERCGALGAAPADRGGHGLRAHGIGAGKNTQAWIGQGIALAPLLFVRAGVQ